MNTKDIHVIGNRLFLGCFKVCSAYLTLPRKLGEI